jgi:hypothetical protein
MAGRIDIGIDGGGTGCRVAISVDGGAVTETRGGSANIVTDPAGPEAAIREALLKGWRSMASASTTWVRPASAPVWRAGACPAPPTPSPPACPSSPTWSTTA